MIDIEMYYRKFGKGNARLARVTDAVGDEPARYAIFHTPYDKETGKPLPEETLATFILQDLTDTKKRLRDRVDLLTQLITDAGAFP